MLADRDAPRTACNLNFRSEDGKTVRNESNSGKCAVEEWDAYPSAHLSMTSTDYSESYPETPNSPRAHSWPSLQSIIYKSLSQGEERQASSFLLSLQEVDTALDAQIEPFSIRISQVKERPPKLLDLDRATLVRRRITKAED